MVCEDRQCGHLEVVYVSLTDRDKDSAFQGVEARFGQVNSVWNRWTVFSIIQQDISAELAYRQHQ
jgi:hypothetical protein